jgi:hypothetical protein
VEPWRFGNECEKPVEEVCNETLKKMEEEKTSTNDDKVSIPIWLNDDGKASLIEKNP